jgi:hypothetical protein
MAICYIDPDPFFKPQRMFITAIDRGNPTTITTSVDHGYVTGLMVQVFLPRECNMPQLNNAQAAITVTGDDTFTIPIDSTNFDVFVDPADPNTCGQVALIGQVPGQDLEPFKNVKERG